MTRPLFVHADVRITQGDEEIRVRGQDHRIEVSHSSIRFLLKTVRRLSAVSYPRVLTLDQMLRDLGLTVFLKTKYMYFALLGVNARKWVRLVLRFVLPS